VKFTRRQTLGLAAAASVAGLAGGLPTIALAKEGDQLDQLKLMAPAGIPDKISGNPDAKVTVIEYASPTCPHCALFANTVLQPFEDKYVTTGKVKFILRPFARNTMDAAIFMLAEAAAKSADGISLTAPTTPADASSASQQDTAAGQGQSGAATPAYSANAVKAAENVISTFFKTQDTWGLSDKPLDAVKAVAFQLGFSEESFNQALQDQDYFNKIQTMRDQAMKDFGLEGTPTFYVNGKQLTGEKTLEQLSAEIDPLL
jgi:protein-disulfide isomerase